MQNFPAFTQTFSGKKVVGKPAGRYTKSEWILNTIEILTSFAILTKGGLATFRSKKARFLTSECGNFDLFSKEPGVEITWSSKTKKPMFTLFGRTDTVDWIANRLYDLKAFELVALRSFTMEQAKDAAYVEHGDHFDQTVFAIREMLRSSNAYVLCHTASSVTAGYLCLKTNGRIGFVSRKRMPPTPRVPFHTLLHDMEWFSEAGMEGSLYSNLHHEQRLKSPKGWKDLKPLVSHLKDHDIRYFSLPTRVIQYGAKKTRGSIAASTLNSQLVKMGRSVRWLVSIKVNAKDATVPGLPPAPKGLGARAAKKWEKSLATDMTYIPWLPPNPSVIWMKLFERRIGKRGNLLGGQMVLVCDKYVPSYKIKRKLKTDHNPALQVLSWASV